MARRNSYQKQKRLLNRWDIFTQFIKPTLLAHDTKGFWIFRDMLSRWTPHDVAECLEKAGLAKVSSRNIHGRITTIWLNREPSHKEIEDACLSETDKKRILKYKTG